MNDMLKRLLSLVMVLSMVMSFAVMPVAATESEAPACTEHGWNDGEVTLAATCTEAGVKTFACGSCGATRTEEIAPGHTWNEGEITTAATCTEDGVKTISCTVEGCNETRTEAVTAPGHTWGDDNTCDVESCGAVKCDGTAECASTLGHENCLSQCTGLLVCDNTAHKEGCLSQMDCTCVRLCSETMACAVCEAGGECQGGVVAEKIATVQKLINELPTQYNYKDREAVKAQYNACTAEIAKLTDAQRAELDMTNYTAAANPQVANTPDDKPNAEVTVRDRMTLGGDVSYSIFNGSLISNVTEERPLDIVMNFKANDDAAAGAASYYAKWKTDFYITVTGLTNGSMVGDADSYLAGRYEDGAFESLGWIVIPLSYLGDFTIVNGESYPIVSLYDDNLTYENICDYVKSFTAAIHLSDALLEQHPNIQIKLELKMVNPDNAEDVLTVGGYSYTLADLRDAEDFVAEIGSKKYLSLQSAVDNAQDNDTVTLLKSVEYNSSNGSVNGEWVDGLVYTGDKSFTINLGGNTISCDDTLNDYLVIFKNKGTKANTITLTNGTISGGKNLWNVVVAGAGNSQVTTLNLNGVTVNGDGSGNNGEDGVVRARNGSIVNVNSGTTINSTSAMYALHATTSDATVNLNDGAVVNMNYNYAYGIAVTGTGTMNINGGTVNAAAKAKAVQPSSSGTPVANIKGGTINGAVVSGADVSSYPNAKSTVNITGGTVNGTLSVTDWGATGVSVLNITGGTFSNDPSAYVAAGYGATENNGVWTVAKEEIEAERPSVTIAPDAADDKYVDEIRDSNANQSNTALEQELEKVATEEVINKLLPQLQEQLETAGERSNVEKTRVGAKVEYQGSTTATNGDVTFKYHVEPQLQALNEDGEVIGGVKIPNADIKAANTKLTIRLDIDAAEGVNFAQLFHIDPVTNAAEDMGLYEIIRKDGKCYVEFYSDTFSEYTATTKAEVTSLNAALNGKKYETLQEAVNAASLVPGDHTITILGTCDETVVIKQTAGVNLTITGGTMTGQFIVDGDNRYTEDETVTFKNITFDGSGKTDTHYFIDIPVSYGGRNNLYGHNVTVSGCNFTGAGKGASDTAVVAVRARQAYGLTITGGTASNMHSLLQDTNSRDVVVSGVTLDTYEGINLTGSTRTTVENCAITSATYGVRYTMDSDSTNNVITGTTVNGGESPVVVRGKNPAGTGANNFDLAVTGGSMTSSSGKDWLEITGDHADEFDIAITTDNPNAAAPAEAVAKVNNTFYTDIAEAIAEVNANGGTMTLLADVGMAAGMGDDMVLTINSTATLDLNGHNADGTITVGSSGNLTFKDSKPTMTGTLGNSFNGSIATSGTFILESGALNGSLTVNGGTAEIKKDGMISIGDSGGTAVFVTGGALKVSGRRISGQGNSIEQTNNGTVEILGGDIFAPMSGTGITVPGLVNGEPNEATFTHDPTAFCVARYAGKKGADNRYSIVPAAASVTSGSGTTQDTDYFATVEQALAELGNGETLTIIPDAAKPAEDVSVSKTADMTITADGKGGVKITTENALTGKTYGAIEVGGKTYFVTPKTGTVTIAADGSVSGDNVAADKDGKPAYSLQVPLYGNVFVKGSTTDIVINTSAFPGTVQRIYLLAPDGKTEYELYGAITRGVTPNGVSFVNNQLTLTDTYLNQSFLTAYNDKTYTVVYEFNDGAAPVGMPLWIKPATYYYVADTTNPKTGDAIFAPAMMMLFSASALAVLLLGKKKRA